MKNILFILALVSVSLVNAQAFTGKGDTKFQVGGNVQDNATGLTVSYDHGIGENISLGLSSTYALGVESVLDADFGNRFDIRARFNANLGNVINIDENFDIYPGLSFGLKNFGGHLGVRYFFTSGFGIHTEFNAPLAKYDTGFLTPAEKLHNQFTVTLGATFKL
jgi:outer membrane protein G